MSPELANFAAVVFVSFTSGALAGFGSVIIALTLASHLQPIEWMVPRLVLLNVFLNGYLVLAHRGHIAWSLILRRVIPVMGLGAGIGVLVSARWEGPTLMAMFGILVVGLSLVELYRLFKRTVVVPAEASLGIVLAAGVMHGIYASGGPMLVYALGRTSLDRTAFRSTLAVVWLVMNIVLTAVFFLDGRLDGPASIDVAFLLPSVIAATVVGEVLHQKVDERGFRIVLYMLLLGAGAALLFR